MIDKIQTNTENQKKHEYFYPSARDAMFAFVNNVYKLGYDKILLPGYIGWSPKEGSGIFDPINDIVGLKRDYYKMGKDLEINEEDLLSKVHDKTIVLLVNYFGFRDRNIFRLVEKLRKSDVILLEDNAHGLFTYNFNDRIESDATFFSLHKMLPYKTGGSLIISNPNLFEMELEYRNDLKVNPYEYDLFEISKIRRGNFQNIMSLIKDNEYFYPLRNEEDIKDNVPQTFPVIIRKGNRDVIYEKMNQKGYGVVSLYHTLIEELRNEEFEDALWVSKRILNLPVHQDVEKGYYPAMLDLLTDLCRESGE